MSDDGVEVLTAGTAHNHRFEVRQIRNRHFAGYVRTNFGPAWSYDDIRGHMSGLVECHGGLTYGVDEDGWVGFDCAHAGDVCILDGEEQTDHPGVDMREWHVDDVAAECRKVARQIHTLESFAEKFEDREWGFDDA
jgi:hypothetical protein